MISWGHSQDINGPGPSLLDVSLQIWFHPRRGEVHIVDLAGGPACCASGAYDFFRQVPWLGMPWDCGSL